MYNVIAVHPPHLALESCEHRHIDNERILEIAPTEANQFREFDSDFGDRVVRRSEPTPHYNCHGMTFASRRTGIFEESVIQQIIAEDRYFEVPEANVLPGDVILYIDSFGLVEHSGIVIEEPKPENLNIPRVCSKWGKYAELLHLSTHCPYNLSNVKYYRMNYDPPAVPKV